MLFKSWFFSENRPKYPFRGKGLHFGGRYENGQNMAGASLGKVVDMLHSKQISSPTGKLKWTRATVDHLLSNGKYVAVVGLEKFLDVQFEKAARCNIDYDKDGAPRKDTRYVSPAVVQI